MSTTLDDATLSRVLDALDDAMQLAADAAEHWRHEGGEDSPRAREYDDDARRFEELRRDVERAKVAAGGYAA